MAEQKLDVLDGLEVDNDVIITNGGIGINQSTPAADIHIKGNAPKIRLEETDANRYGEVWSQAGNIYIDADTGNGGTHSVHIRAGGQSEVARFAEGGKVGIGGIVPTGALDVFGGDIVLWDSGSTDSLTLQASTTSSYRNYIKHGDLGLEFNNNSTSRGYVWSVNGSEVMRMTSTAHFGVGNTAPDRAMVLQSDDDYPLLVRSTAANRAGISLTETGTSSTTGIAAVNNELRFIAGGSDRGRFSGADFIPISDGFGGIGTTTIRWGNGYFDDLTVTNTISGNITGNAATAGTATNFNVVADNATNATHYVIFTGAATGGQSPNSDTGLTYNPSTNTLTVANLAGNASTASNATNATNATNFNVAADNDTNANHYVIFTGGATGNQRPNSDTGLLYNPSTNTLTATNFAGTATRATDADRVNVNATGSDLNFRMIFTEPNDSADTSGIIYKDNATNFYYNPSTNTLTCPNFAGNATSATSATNATNATNAATADYATSAGTAGSATSATNATNATNFNVAADNSTNANHYVIFTGGATGNQRPNSDTGLLYNPSTNTLTATTFAGNASTATSATNATNATNFNVLADNSTNANHYIIFTDGATGNQRPNSDTGLLYNPSTNTLTATTFAGNASTATRATDADRVNVNATSSSQNFRMIFTEANDSADTSGIIYKDNATNFYYNPSTNVLVVGTVNSTSDIRHKSNIETLTGALEKVNAMRGVSFDLRNQRQVGLIAQELLEIVPEVVDTSNEEMYTVSYGNMVGVLVEAIKELSAKVDALTK